MRDWFTDSQLDMIGLYSEYKSILLRVFGSSPQLMLLNLFRLTQYGRRPDDRLHASGHASGDELKEMIDEIKSKQIIPIHTEHPETMKKFHQNVVILKEKDVFTL